MRRINNYIKMISFNDYILEKLHLNKDTKISLLDDRILIVLLNIYNLKLSDSTIEDIDSLDLAPVLKEMKVKNSINDVRLFVEDIDEFKGYGNNMELIDKYIEENKEEIEKIFDNTDSDGIYYNKEKGLGLYKLISSSNTYFYIDFDGTSKPYNHIMVVKK